MKFSITALQPLGRALMLPIAVLPVAGMLLRLGQADVLNLPFVAAAGDAIFSNLGLLFAIGIAVGFARLNNGAAGLAGCVCFLVASKGAEALVHVPHDAIAAFTGEAKDLATAAFKAKELGKLGIPLGIASGLIAGLSYNRFSDIELPDYLAFFGGRRFVPIISGFAGVGLALLFGLAWPVLEHAMDAMSHAVLNAGNVGLFAYGILNRLLLVTGLHHILNNIAWFLLGDYGGTTGDLKRFFAGDPSAGGFMAGFFPVMMFGLPAACLAMYHAAPASQRKSVGGMQLSMALTSMITGVTEPIEFSFMFSSPLLFALHAALTGISMVVMNVLNVKLGFGFSAGLFDYILNFKKATHPLLLLPVGLVYAVLYYSIFRFCIRRFNLETPGREKDRPVEAPAAMINRSSRAAAYIHALGGADNLESIDACTTRLRLGVKNSGALDTAKLKQLGARGVMVISPTNVQIVLGPIADQVAGELRSCLTNQNRYDRVYEEVPRQIIEALGGTTSIDNLHINTHRIIATLKPTTVLNAEQLDALCPRGVALPSPTTVHMLFGPEANDIYATMQSILRSATTNT